MTTKHEWLHKKTPRSVDQLRLWPGNPRLTPDESHIYLSDYAEDLTNDENEKSHFFDLIKSILNDGFIPADPIVVWKEKNKHFYVAEGNRRVLALKLLREPNKAPRSIRPFITKQSEKIDKKSIEKIMVNVAPSFEDAEWYINQRNSTSSLQRPWSRIQQHRWLAELYYKYNDDIDKIMSITKMSRPELENIIRTLKIKDYVKESTVQEVLSEKELEAATSHKFPVTVLERFFSNKEVREKWGIDFDSTNVILKNKEGFLKAYAQLIKNIVSEDKDRIKIDTRTVTSDLENILSKLPNIDLTVTDYSDGNVLLTKKSNVEKSKTNSEDSTNNSQKENQYKKNDPKRNRLILPIYHIKTGSRRIADLFEELKKVPLKYENTVAASIRVFLDLAVLNYIEGKGYEADISRTYKCNLRDVNLKSRLEYLKKNKLKNSEKKIIDRLLKSSNELSLDVLNGFVHSDGTSYITQEFLNRLWDFMFPLFEVLLDIKEDKNKS